MVKHCREFGSPHNTSFFILGSLSIGMLYSFWGYFTGLLEMNLLEGLGLYLSPWTIIFALPYLVYGSFSLYSCFRRYDVVYIRQTPFNAHKFGIFFTSLTAILGIFYSLFFDVFIESVNFPLEPIHVYPDLMLLLLGFISVYFTIRFGIFGARTVIPDISRVVTNIRRQIPVSNRSSAERTISVALPTKKKKSTTTPDKKSKWSSKFEKLKPKAGILTLDDFKCIFCFKLPKLPADAGRGIILCPNCKHPAHADEFKDWLKLSNLCSRCDATIPTRFRRNPKIIPVKEYLKVFKEFSKKTKKK